MYMTEISKETHLRSEITEYNFPKTCVFVIYEIFLGIFRDTFNSKTHKNLGASQISKKPAGKTYKIRGKLQIT